MKIYIYIYIFLRKEKKTQKIFFFLRKKSLKGAAWKWSPQVPLERTVGAGVWEPVPAYKGWA